ncbi:MAG: hypothetical protein R6U08_01120 [Bacillota bacterium]
MDLTITGLVSTEAYWSDWRKGFEELGEKVFPGNGLRKLTPVKEENLCLKRQLADVTEESGDYRVCLKYHFLHLQNLFSVQSKI